MSFWNNLGDATLGLMPNTAPAYWGLKSGLPKINEAMQQTNNKPKSVLGSVKGEATAGWDGSRQQDNALQRVDDFISSVVGQMQGMFGNQLQAGSNPMQDRYYADLISKTPTFDEQRQAGIEALNIKHGHNKELNQQNFGFAQAMSGQDYRQNLGLMDNEYRLRGQELGQMQGYTQDNMRLQSDLNVKEEDNAALNQYALDNQQMNAMLQATDVQANASMLNNYNTNKANQEAAFMQMIAGIFG